MLLLFQGPDHAAAGGSRGATGCGRRCARSADLRTTSGAVTLRMSVGIHSGDFDFFLVGDPALHRELLVSGPGASITAEMEAAAAAGQIGLSPTTAALLAAAAGRRTAGRRPAAALAAGAGRPS